METTYPTGRVIALYTLLGGATGGFLVGLGAAIISIDPYVFLWAIYTIPVGFILGLIPALLTGWALAYGQFYRHKKSLLWAFVMGDVISMVYGLILLMAMNPMSQDMLSNLLLSCLMGLVGGISAVLVALFALPKKEIQIEKFDSLHSKTKQ